MEDYAYINFFGIDGRAAMLACDRHGVTPDVLLFHSKKSFRGNNMEEEQVLIRYTMRERSRQNMLRKLLAVKTSLIVAGTVAGLWKERKELYPDAPKVPKFSKKQLAKAAESVDTESDPDVIDERGRPNPAVMAELERSTSPTPPPSSSPPMQQSPFLLNASNPAPNTEEAPHTQLLASEAASPFAAQHVEHSTPPQPPVEEVPLFQVMVDGMEEEKEATDATHAVEKVPSATSSSSPPKPPQVMHSITSPSVAASTPVVPASSTTSSHKAVVAGSPIHREWSVPAPPTPSSPPAVVQEASLGQTPNTKVEGEAGEAGHNLTPPVVALDVPSLSTNVVVANATSASASAAAQDVDSDHHHQPPQQQQQSPQQHSVVSPPPASQASVHTTSIAATPAAPTPAEEAQASDAPAMSANPRSVTFNNSAVETGALTQTEEEHTVGTTQAFESPSRATPDSQRDGPEAGDRPAGLRPRPPSVCSQTRRERGGEKRASSLHFLQALSERQHQARLSSGMAPHYPSPPPSPPIPYFARNKESLQWEDEELEETQKELAAYGLRAPKQARIFRRYRNDLQARERAERKQQEAQKREKARAAARAAFPTAERPPLCPAAAGPSAKTAPPAPHLEPLIKDSHQKQLEAFRRVAMVDAARNKKNFRKGAMLDKDLEQFATMGTLEHDLQFQASIGKKQPREVVVAAVVQARAAHKKSATRYVDRQWKMEKSLDKRVLRALDKAKTHKQRTEVLHKEVNASRADISRMHREMAERREQRRRHREFARTERRHHRADEFVHRNDGMALQKRFEHDKEALFRRDIKQKLHAMDTRRDWDLDVLRSMTED